MPKKPPDDVEKPLPAWVASACTRCGKCCLDEHYMLTLSATDEDVARWEEEGREDILQYVDTVKPGTHDLWIRDGEELARCPFVRKDKGKPTYRCTIYETRPEACRKYPVSAGQMVALGCEIVIELDSVVSSIRSIKPGQS
jgi:Fe-S-cluster containining protein